MIILFFISLIGIISIISLRYWEMKRGRDILGSYQAQIVRKARIFIKMFFLLSWRIFILILRYSYWLFGLSVKFIKSMFRKILQFIFSIKLGNVANARKEVMIKPASFLKQVAHYRNVSRARIRDQG